jgi:hypothetical protein
MFYDKTSGNASPIMIADGGHRDDRHSYLFLFIVFIIFAILIFAWMGRHKESGGFETLAGAKILSENSGRGNYSEHNYLNAMENRQDQRNDAIKNIEKHGQTQTEIVNSERRVEKEILESERRTQLQIAEVKQQIADNARRESERREAEKDREIQHLKTVRECRYVPGERNWGRGRYCYEE